MNRWLLFFTIILNISSFAQKYEEPPPPEFPEISFSSINEGVGGMYLFSNYSFAQLQVQPHLLKINGSGELLFSRMLDSSGTDFKLQKNGMYSYCDVKRGKYYLLNEKMRIVDSVIAKGFITNNHELQILKNGNILLIGDQERQMDISHIVPGRTDTATVIGNVIIEYDKAGNQVFEWNSFDYFKLTDAAPDINLSAKVIDFVHTNAIEEDSDGNLLISSRNIDEITKIDRRTGKILWRMGGKNNQFTFVNDPYLFSHQHDIRRLKNGNILLFDNGNGRRPQYSRVVEYRLDEVKKKATLVWEYHHSPQIFSAAMGSAQRLDNGNTLIGWGFNVSYATGQQTIAATEVTPEGSTVMEMHLEEFNYSYRVFYVPPENDNSTVSTVEKNESNDPFPKIKLRLFPIPAKEYITLLLEGGDHTNAECTMYNVTGTECYKTTVRLANGTASVTVPLKGIAPGLYTVVVRSNSEFITQKFIISR